MYIIKYLTLISCIIFHINTLCTHSTHNINGTNYKSLSSTLNNKKKETHYYTSYDKAHAAILEAAQENDTQKLCDALLQYDEAHAENHKTKHYYINQFVQALHNQDVKSIVDCLDHGVDVNMRIQEEHNSYDNLDQEAVVNYYNTPLHYAVAYNNLAISKVLIKRNSAIDALNAQGKSALYYTHNNYDTALLTLLVQHNANLDGTDMWNQSFLDYLYAENNIEAIKILLSHGAYIRENFQELPFPSKASSYLYRLVLSIQELDTRNKYNHIITPYDITSITNSFEDQQSQLVYDIISIYIQRCIAHHNLEQARCFLFILKLKDVSSVAQRSCIKHSEHGDLKKLGELALFIVKHKLTCLLPHHHNALLSYGYKWIQKSLNPSAAYVISLNTKDKEITPQAINIEIEAYQTAKKLNFKQLGRLIRTWSFYTLLFSSSKTNPQKSNFKYALNSIFTDEIASLISIFIAPPGSDLL